MYIQNKSWRSHGGGSLYPTTSTTISKASLFLWFLAGRCTPQTSTQTVLCSLSPCAVLYSLYPPYLFFSSFFHQLWHIYSFLSLSLLLAFLSPSFPIPYIGVAVLFTTQRFRSLRFRVSFAVPYSRTATAASFLCCLPSLYSNTTPPRLGKGKKKYYCDPM